jgi:hypothetical protein
MKKLLGMLALILWAHPAAAQSAGDALKPGSCEHDVATLTAAGRTAGEAGLVIVIARLGEGERGRELNRRRLHNARTLLEDYGERAPDTIITAEGERVAGHGRLELYVAGKLFEVIALRRNADLLIGACLFEGRDPCGLEREKKLYSCLDKGSRAKQSKRRESDGGARQPHR